MTKKIQRNELKIELWTDLVESSLFLTTKSSNEASRCPKTPIFSPAAGRKPFKKNTCKTITAPPSRTFFRRGQLKRTISRNENSMLSQSIIAIRTAVSTFPPSPCGTVQDPVAFFGTFFCKSQGLQFSRSENCKCAWHGCGYIDSTV